MFVRRCYGVVPFFPRFPRSRINARKFQCGGQQVANVVRGDFSKSIVRTRVVSNIRGVSGVVLIFPTCQVGNIAILSSSPFPFLVKIFRVRGGRVSSIYASLVYHDVVRIGGVLSRLTFFLLSTTLFVSLYGRRASLFLYNLLLFFFQFSPRRVRRAVNDCYRGYDDQPSYSRHGLGGSYRARERLVQVFRSRAS